MSAANTNANSQIRFIREISKADLREFIYRATQDLSSLFTNELHNRHLEGKYPNTNLNAELKVSPNYTNPPDIYLVINIYNKINKIINKICHITFHLIPSNCNKYLSRSPIHITNNRSTRRSRRIFINHKNLECGNKYTLTVSSIVTPSYNIYDDALELSSIVVDIFNKWFDPSNSDSIYIHSHGDKNDRNIEKMIGTIEDWRHNKISRGGRKRYTRHAK